MIGKTARNTTERDKLRRRVLREESICHLCDQWVDVRLPQWLPGSPEVDHVVPIFHGGAPFDRANVRLSHRYCNRLRWHYPVRVGRERIAESRPAFDANGQLASTAPEAVASREWL